MSLTKSSECGFILNYRSACQRDCAVGEDRPEHDLFLSHADKLHLARAVRMKLLDVAVGPGNEAYDAADSL